MAQAGFILYAISLGISVAFNQEMGLSHIGTPIVFLLFAIYLELARKGDS